MNRINRACSMVALAAVVALGLMVPAFAQPQIPPPDWGGGGDPGPPPPTPIETLGRLIFFDATLSTPDGMSCASCHAPESGWAGQPGQPRLPTSEGVVAGRFGMRNPLTVTYADLTPGFHYDALTGGFAGGYYRDGRAQEAIDQIRIPFLSRLEMNNPDVKQVVRDIRRSSYAGLFEEVFGPGFWHDDERAFDRVVEAVVAFEKSAELNRFDTRFDRFRAGETGALTLQERSGLALFEGRAGCTACHPSQTHPDGRPALFTTYRYYNLGVPRNPKNPFYDMPASINPEGDDYVDPGLGGHLAGPAASAERGKFKVPSLRNVARTAPYMHNGAFDTLLEAVMFHNTRDIDPVWGPPEVAGNVYTGPPVTWALPVPDRPTLPPWPPEDPGGRVPRVGDLMLAPGEVADIVAFLQALSDRAGMPVAVPRPELP